MRSLSIFALIAANLVPLFGVLFYDWDAGLVLGLFWIENLIIGGFNLGKMLFVTIRNKSFESLALSLFFVLHFGIFCSAHGALLWDLLGYGDIEPQKFLALKNLGPLTLFLDGATVFFGFLEKHGSILLLGMGALVLSHLVSFIEHFLLRGEIFDLTANKLMGKPYGHIIVMHAGLIIGAMAIEKFGSTIWLLLVMVVFKLSVDIKLHLKRHKNLNPTLASSD